LLFLYLATAGLGATLIVLSMLLGGGEGDADLDADVDADIDADADGGDSDGGTGLFGWLPLASMRFWTFLLAAFGLTGSGLTLGGAPFALTLAVASIVALVTGSAAAAFFRALLRDRVSGETTLDSLVGREARVSLPVRPGHRGKITIKTSAGVIELTATTGDARELARGEAVLITRVDAGIADITSLAALPAPSVTSAETVPREAEKVGVEASDSVSNP